MNFTAIREALLQEPSILDVHDLHVWTLTSGVNAMSVHVVRPDEVSPDDVLAIVHQRIKSGFKVAHLTVQVESHAGASGETHL